MSLAVRLSAAFVGLIALTAVALGAAGLFAAERGVSGQVDNFLEARAGELIRGDRGRPGATINNNIRNSNTRNDGGRRSDDRRDGPDARRQSAEPDSVVQELGPDGTAVSTGLALPVNDIDLRLASGDQRRPQLRTVDTDEGKFRVITVALPDGGAVQVGRELAESSSAVGRIRSQLIPIIAVLAAIGAVLGLVLARNITGPLRSLATSVDTVARTGDLDVPIEVEGDDEVGRLASGFQNLLGNLADSRQRQHRLVQDAAHELRTPLTSVKANIDLLAVAPDMDARERAQTFDSVRAELRELTQLVDEIVDVATDRYSPQALISVDLAAVAAEAVGRFRTRTGRTVELRSATKVMSLGDAESLERAIGNLLSNADKYSPAGEPVLVELTTERRLIVADSGPGIAVTDQPLVFDRFYRADTARAEPGSGLGLSIVKSIVDAHGGTVEIADRPGGGTVVGFTLPDPLSHT